MIDKREIIASALLDGDDPKARLVAAGVSPASADYEVKRLARDPMAVALERAGRRLYKREWMLQIHTKLAHARPAGFNVPRVDSIESEAFFDQYYAMNRPVILTGLVDHWPAMTKWSLDYLDEQVGDGFIQVQVGRNSGHSELDKDKMAKAATVRAVTQAIRATESTNDFYVTAYDSDANRAALAPLYDDLGPITILRAGTEQPGFFWLGPKGTRTPFHHDLTNNLLVQVMGRKKVLLVPSWEVGRMQNTLHCYSDRDPGDWTIADDNLPPLMEVILKPGEALFLPIGWWHHVEALDPSISMSFTNFDADNDFYSDYRGYFAY